MNAFFRKLYPTPHGVTGKHKLRQLRLLYASVTAAALFGIVQHIFSVTIGGEAERANAWLFIIFSFISIIGYFLIRAGFTNWVGTGLILAGGGFATYVARDLAGLHDAAVFVYILMMLSAPVLINKRVFFAVTILSFASIWYLAYLQNSGQLVPIIARPYNVAIDFSIMFLMIAFVIYYFTTALQDAIDEANRETQERKVIEEELKKRAITDFLTGINNRRHFFDLSSIEYSKAVRYKRKIAVMIFDIDHFKNVNDTYGHAIGDKVLIHFSQLMVSNIRESDVFARFGGEEFILLMIESGCQSAMAMAERAREIIEQTPFTDGELSINITVSAGVAGEDEIQEGGSLEDLIRKADVALYDAKQTGRNRVVRYSDICGDEEI